MIGESCWIRWKFCLVCLERVSWTTVGVYVLLSFVDSIVKGLNYESLVGLCLGLINNQG